MPPAAAGRAAQTPTGIAIDPILQPPYENDKPIDVTIALRIVNIAAIDEVNEQFDMDAYLFARWIDPRLAFTPRTRHPCLPHKHMGRG